jgi:hypothetical protein
LNEWFWNELGGIHEALHDRVLQARGSE